MDIATQIKQALEPLQPYYMLAYTPGDTEIEVAVYDPSTHDRSAEFKVTPSFARTLLDGANHFDDGADGHEYEDFVKLLDKLDAGNIPPQQLTCTLSDAIEFLIDAWKRGRFEVTIDGAHWLVIR